MKKITRTLCAFALFTALTAPAAAQDEPAETTYDFEDHDVDGGYHSPLGESLIVRQGAGRTSLVEARAHYIPELLKSVERL